MIQFRPKVRRRVAQEITYTYRNQDKAIINLSAYQLVKLEVKNQGVVYATVDAEFTDKSLGAVRCPSFKFDTVGVWDVQFFCQVNFDDDAERLYGEPIQITVVKNVEDLTIDEKTDY